MISICLRRCAVLVTALLGVACSKREGEISWWQAEQERIELRQQLTLKEFRLDQMGSKNHIMLEQLRNETVDLTRSRVALSHRKSALKSELESMKVELVDLRESLIRDKRQRAIGTKFEEIISLSGRVYRDVTVASVEDSGIAIRHADGTARLKYGDLSSRQCSEFGLEAGLATNADAKEAEDVIAYDRWIDQRMAEHREKEEKLRKIASTEAVAARERSQLASIATSAASERLLAQPATTVGTRYYSRYSSSYYPRRSHYYPVYQYCRPAPRYGCSPAGSYNYRYAQQLSSGTPTGLKCY